MRTISKIVEHAVQCCRLLFRSCIFLVLLSSASKAGTDSLSAPLDTRDMFRPHGELLLDCKAYIKNLKPSYTRRARKVSIECVNLSDNSHTFYSSRSGKISLEFKLDTRYLVYVSKQGYETKMLAFSTKGANPIEHYGFDFDIQLEKTDRATYDEFTPSIYIVYNRTHRLFLYKRYYNKSASNR